MTLERRLVVASLLVGLPVAAAVAQSVSWLRQQDLLAALERVVTSQINVSLRERCEADPTWFLTGSLNNRPRPTDPKPGPDDIPARPHLEDEPYQLFAYDDEYIQSSPAGVRFPTAYKNAMRAGAQWEAGPWDAPSGTGEQFALRTGWTGGPCAELLGRMDAPPNARLDWWLSFLGVEGLFAAVFVGIGTPTVRRIRAVARAARQAARSDWTVVVPADGHDELTAVGAALNEASADLRRRMKDVADREETHRRFLGRTFAEIGQPLAGLADELATGPTATGVREAHDLSLHLANLLAGARLRMHLGPTALEPVDLTALVTDVVARLAGFAKRSGVSLRSTTPTDLVMVTADRTLLDQAIVNLVDNAIRYNRPGGTVLVVLGRDPSGFGLRITDNGPGVDEEKLAELSAIRRFRGDEGRVERVRQRGLGLALVWEVLERSQLSLALRSVPGGGFEAEIRGAGVAAPTETPQNS